MPHFYATKSLDSQTLPFQSGDFEFLLCATDCLFETSSLVLVRYKGKEEFFIRILLKQENTPKQKDAPKQESTDSNPRYLYKCHKHTTPTPIGIAKDALQALSAKLDSTISHNLSPNTLAQSTQSEFLLTPQQVFAFLQDSYNFENLSLEIGFGSGRHLLNLATNAQKEKSNARFLGLEIYKPAIEQALRQIKLLNLENLYISNLDARLLLELMPQDSLNAIYLHFPVPWGKKPHRRVFSKTFLHHALCALKIGGFLHLRTDDVGYFEDSLQILKNAQAEYRVEKNASLSVVSKYEARWRRQKKDIYDVFVYKNTPSQIRAQTSGDFEFSKAQQSAFYKKAQFFAKNPQNLPKVLKKDYFLHINSIYKNKDCFIVSVSFGDFYQPQNSFILIQNHAARYVGKDLLPTNAALSAHKLLCEILTSKEEL
ncbi:tRNA (guanosine(46)-N7)-methyltransferase TrmB [Helicobacter sp. MIT 00-7814]|uniref:tRNA (guanosine(46)-N7)-methyltransferase TrmB n=1 Tax=unclassified Helicobacter TaxID=2593540 RepID=UPI000E1E7F6D|nr:MULTISPECIES: tRNA (guanosine(46)-N7)-methyltransferase TrmB [unclassified Helicobacter]RDU55887.1 tRNA (guanosine(46)-N7)-methyltransferase TrmB [Helicobacter sp. MIT 00-7814]RDU56845.1 tRNA (guanosine(46)-N7)-methyltransferase TrmB [Helicobacter sp. MIT 99-10781]